MAIPNEQMAQAWEGEALTWAADPHRHDRAIEAYHRRLLEAAAVAPGERVVDVGCGTGQVTRDAARLSGTGAVLGLDLSTGMIGAARALAEAEGIANATFEVGDAQVHPFDPGATDLVVSRFGTMFFVDPVAAFANIAAATRPGGRLVMVVWQPMERVEWMLEVREALAVGRTLPAPAVGAPGPLGLADPDQTRGILAAAGFDQVAIDAIEEPFRVGDDVDDAFDLARNMGVARGLLGDLDDDGRAKALDALRATLAAHETDEGVVYDSAGWMVRARRP